MWCMLSGVFCGASAPPTPSADMDPSAPPRGPVCVSGPVDMDPSAPPTPVCGGPRLAGADTPRTRPVRRESVTARTRPCPHTRDADTSCRHGPVESARCRRERRPRSSTAAAAQPDRRRRPDGCAAPLRAGACGPAAPGRDSYVSIGITPCRCFPDGCLPSPPVDSLQQAGPSVPWRSRHGPNQPGGAQGEAPGPGQSESLASFDAQRFAKPGLSPRDTVSCAAQIRQRLRAQARPARAKASSGGFSSRPPPCTPLHGWNLSGRALLGPSMWPASVGRSVAA